MTLPPLTLNAWLRFGLIERTLDRRNGIRSVLEIGAGEGAVAVRLALRYDYVGVEPDARSSARARERLERAGRPARVLEDVSQLPPATRFDLVCAFEVLEHIEDDAGALRAWWERVDGGGSLVLSVPAHQRRYGPWDRRVGHFRRYERDQLRDLVRGAGFEDPQVLVYGFPLGYALEWARDAMARREERDISMADATASSGRLKQPPQSMAWGTRLATAPFRLVQRPFVRSDLGVGYVVSARKPG